MTTHVFSLLNDAGKKAMMTRLVSAYPGLKDVDFEAFEQRLDSAYQAALGCCNGELVMLEAVYQDNDQLYGGDTVEVPEGASVFLPAIEEVLNTRWYEGNEFSTTEIRLMRRNLITSFSVINFQNAFVHARTALSAKDDERAKAVCGILSKALDPIDNKTTLCAQMKAFFGVLDSGSAEEEPKADGLMQGFMDTKYSSEELAQYLIDLGTQLQLSQYPCGTDISVEALCLFQVACAIRTMGLTFEDYLEA